MPGTLVQYMLGKLQYLMNETSTSIPRYLSSTYLLIFSARIFVLFCINTSDNTPQNPRALWILVVPYQVGMQLPLNSQRFHGYSKKSRSRLAYDVRYFADIKESTAKVGWISGISSPRKKATEQELHSN